jgi:hypothetical protein
VFVTIHSPRALRPHVGNFGTSYDCACATESSDHISVNLEHSKTAHARLFTDLGPSDHMYVTFEHPTTAHARLFIDLVPSDHIPVNVVHPTTAHARLFIVLFSGRRQSRKSLRNENGGICFRRPTLLRAKQRPNC